MKTVRESLNKVRYLQLPEGTDQTDRSIQTADSNEAYAQNVLNSKSFGEFHTIIEPLFNYSIQLNTHEGYNTLVNIMELNRSYLFAIGELLSSSIKVQYESSVETLSEWIQILKNNNANFLLNCFCSKPLQQTLINYFHAKRNLHIPAFVLYVSVFESHLEFLKSLVRTSYNNFFDSIDTDESTVVIRLEKDAEKVLKLNLHSPCSSYILAYLLKEIIVSLINDRRLLAPLHWSTASKVNVIFSSFLKENKFFDLGSEILHFYLDYLWLNLLSKVEDHDENYLNLIYAFGGFIKLIEDKVIDQSNFQLMELVEYAIEGMLYVEADMDQGLSDGFEFLIVKFPELKSVIIKKLVQALEDNMESNLCLGALCNVVDHLLEKNLIDQSLATELQLAQKVTRVLSRGENQICGSDEEQKRAMWCLTTLVKIDFFDKSLVNKQFVKTVISIDFFTSENCLEVQELFESLIKKLILTKFELATYLLECFSFSSWRIKANILWLFSGNSNNSFMDGSLNQVDLLQKILDSLINFPYNPDVKNGEENFQCQAIHFIDSIVDNDWFDQAFVANIQLVDKLLELLYSDAEVTAFFWLAKLLDKDLIDKSWVVEKPELVKKIATHLVSTSYPYRPKQHVSNNGALLFAEMVRKCFKREDDFLDEFFS